MRAKVARTPEGRIDVRYADLDEVGDDPRAGRHLIGAHVRDNDGTVRTDAQLSAVRVADSHAFLEAEGRL